MGCRLTLAAISIAMGLMIELQGCYLGPWPSMPDVSGTIIAHSAEIQADEQTVSEIMSTFKRAEEALTRRDVDTLMALYSEGYKHHGYTKEMFRAIWNDLFQDYHDFSSTHIFSKIRVEGEQTAKTAMITCTGSLWATSNFTGQRVNIDSWFGDIHYLIYEGGAWRLQGHAWDTATKETRYALPPHPFF